MHIWLSWLACAHFLSGISSFCLFKVVLLHLCHEFSLLSSFKSVKINHEPRFGVVLETTLNNLPSEIKR